VDDNVVGAFTVLTRGIALAGIVVAAGATSFRWGVLPRWSADAPRPLRARVARVGAWGALLTALAAPARLNLEARSLLDPGDPVLPMISNVLRTTWGHGWTLQLVAAVLALVAFLLASRCVRGAWVLAIAATALLALTPALMGHAVAAERHVLVSIGSDWLHVLAAGAWVGALFMLTIVIAAMPPRVPNDDAASTLIAAFHPLALTSAAVLVLSGVTNLLLRVDRLADLVHSSYGAILGVKLVLTGGVIVLGWHHSRKGTRLAMAETRATLMRSLIAETILAALVIGATALLVGTAPPMADMTMN
jgi:putative copper export protein